METTSFQGDPELILSALAPFNNLADDIIAIKTGIEITNNDLVPIDIFDGINLDTIRGNNLNVLDDLSKTINGIRKYATDIIKVSEYGSKIIKDSVNSFNISVGDGTTFFDKINKKISELANDINGIVPKEWIEPVTDDSFETFREDILKTCNTIGMLFANALTAGIVDYLNNQPSEVTESSGGYYYGGGSYQGEPVEYAEEIGEEVPEEVGIVSEEVEEIEEPTEEVVEEGLVEEIEEETIPATIDSVNGNKVVNKVLDSSGNVVAVGTQEDGKKKWYQVSENQVITPTENELTSYRLSRSIEITDNGNKVTIDANDYPVENATYNADGSLKSVRLKCNDYKLTLNLNSNGDINSINYSKAVKGVFIVKNKPYDIYDAYGNIIGKYTDASYQFYETSYSETGNVTGFRLSPDGEYEQWLLVNSSTTPDEYEFYGMTQTDETTTVSMFEKNKPLFGVLGVLFVALGATVVMKKRVAKKEKQSSDDMSDEEYNPNEWDEQGLTTGNYPIYDVKKDDEGKITDARINPLDNEFEYWVKV